MALNSRPLIDPRWYEWVRGPSRGFELATVEILDPKTLVAPPYDAASNTGGEPVPVVVWPVVEGYEEQPYGSGPYAGGYAGITPNAWVEIINRSTQVNGAPQSTDQTKVHVHIDLNTFGDTEQIRAGFLIKVVNGNRDKVLEHRIITIDKVTTGAMAVQRTLECRINEKTWV